MRRKQEHRRFMGLEVLETRRLMAIDLQVEYDPFPDAAEGDELTFVARIHNNGDETAEQVLIRSSLTNELVDPVWERQFGRAKFNPNPYADREPDFSIPAADQSIGSNPWQRITKLGDINGDGLTDFHIETPARRHLGNGYVLFGGLEQDFRDFEDDRIARIEGLGARWLGDVNGDGFNDFIWNSQIIFGAEDIGEGGTLKDPDPNDAPAGGRLNLGELWGLVYGVGDVDADGVDDFVSYYHGQTRVIRGATNLGTLTELTDADIAAATIATIEETGFLTAAGPIGDVNQDGFDDFSFSSIGRGRGVSIVFGGPNIVTGSLRRDELNGLNGFNINPEFDAPGRVWINYLDRFDGDYSVSVPAVTAQSGGDFNGDGMHDLVLRFTGGDLDAPSRAGDYRAGAAVIYGSPTIGAEGVFHVTEDNATFVQMKVFVWNQRPEVTVTDLNGDEYSDLIIDAQGASQFIYGGPDAFDIDIGYGDTHPFIDDHYYEYYEGFNGDNGYATGGYTYRLDINGDGYLDEVARQNETELDIFLGRETPPEPPPTPGTGDIEEVLSIPAGQSVVYTVTGIHRDTGNSIETSAFSLSARDSEDLRDNAVSERSSVLLDMDVSEVTFGEAGNVELEIRIDNRGPSNAVDLRLNESLNDVLEDISWTRTEQVFPTTLYLDELQGADGASFAGPARSTEEIYRGIDALGGTVGVAGDVNGDGVDDVFAIGQNGRDTTSLLFLGGDTVGEGGNLVVAETEIMSSVDPTPADFNGDGFADSVELDAASQETRSRARVTFGTADGIPELAAEDLDGQNGFQVVTDEFPPFVFAELNASWGDINADGFDDLLLGRMEYENRLPVAWAIFGGPGIGQNGTIEPYFARRNNWIHDGSGRHLSGRL